MMIHKKRKEKLKEVSHKQLNTMLWVINYSNFYILYIIIIIIVKKKKRKKEIKQEIQNRKWHTILETISFSTFQL